MKKVLTVIVSAIMVLTLAAPASTQGVVLELVYRGITNQTLAEMTEDGTIPQNVRFLDLRANEISDITPLNELSDLRFLDLRTNPLSNEQIDALTANLPDCVIVFHTPQEPQPPQIPVRICSMCEVSDDNCACEQNMVCGMCVRASQDCRCGSPIECISCFLVECECNKFFLGDVTGTGTVGIADALQILRYTIGLSNTLDGCEKAFGAALIISDETPCIADALQILRHSVGLPSVFGV